MEHELKKEGKYKYFEAGEGIPIIVLHGLMGEKKIFPSAVPPVKIKVKQEKEKSFFKKIWQ